MIKKNSSYSLLCSGILLAVFLLSGCYSPKIITKDNFAPSSTDLDSVIAQIPDYRSTLTAVKGEGKAIVSEPNNSSHITLNFSSDRKRSLITIKNRLGIEGGKILSTPDSLIIYNRIKEFVRIVPVGQGRFSRVNNLASVNLVDILAVPINLSEAAKLLENKKLYRLAFPSGAKVYIDKKSLRVQQVDQPEVSAAPYSRIIYDAYDTIRGFSIPRRITIFSADGSSKVSLLIQSLTVNPKLGELKIEWPEEIPVYRE